ncbi:hypothetical protein LINGRAHAP2_LOCUS28028 [Linum grandiflorum]
MEAEYRRRFHVSGSPGRHQWLQSSPPLMLLY